MVKFLLEIHCKKCIEVFYLGPVKNNNNNNSLCWYDILRHSVISSSDMKLYDVYHDTMWKSTIVTLVISQSEIIHHCVHICCFWFWNIMLRHGFV